MSRLIILALPPVLTSNQLQEHFSALGLPITDVRVLHKKDGQSRRIGFVGFSNNEDAQTAKDWFDGTWLGGSRIKVDYAKEITDAAPPRKRQRPFTEEVSDLTHGDTGNPSTSSLSANVPAHNEAVDLSSVVDVDELREANTFPEDLSDAEYLSQRLRRHVGSQMESQVSSSSRDLQEAAESPAALIEDLEPLPGRLFLRNLPYNVTEADLSQKFSVYGPLEEIHIPTDASGKSKGMAYLTYQDRNLANDVRAKEDGKSFHGRLLHILPASANPGHLPSKTTKRELNSANYKQSKLMQQKGQAVKGSGRRLLFLDSNAVLDAIAARFSTTRSSLVKADSSDSASQMALAESFLLQEIRDYFVSVGISMDALEKPGSQMSRVVVLKRLPFNTTPATIRSLLAPHAQIRRMAVPPSGLIAVAEVESQEQASSTIKALAYTKLDSNIIYVERGAEDTWVPSVGPASMKQHESAATRSSMTRGSSDAQDSKTLYIQNLPNDCTPQMLESAFKGMDGLTRVHISGSSSKGIDSHKQSAFVTFTDSQKAHTALQAMNGHVLGGHMLRIQITESKDDRKSMPGEERKTSKLVIKNVPFEASKSDLQKLLSVYGDIRSLRVPRKSDNSSRGFAFITYATPAHADSAIVGLQDTHLLGRHLIVQRSFDESS